MCRINRKCVVSTRCSGLRLSLLRQTQARFFFGLAFCCVAVVNATTPRPEIHPIKDGGRLWGVVMERGLTNRLQGWEKIVLGQPERYGDSARGRSTISMRFKADVPKAYSQLNITYHYSFDPTFYPDSTSNLSKFFQQLDVMSYTIASFENDKRMRFFLESARTREMNLTGMVFHSLMYDSNFISYDLRKKIIYGLAFTRTSLIDSAANYLSPDLPLQFIEDIRDNIGVAGVSLVDSTFRVHARTMPKPAAPYLIEYDVRKGQLSGFTLPADYDWTTVPEVSRSLSIVSLQQLHKEGSACLEEANQHITWVSGALNWERSPLNISVISICKYAPPSRSVTFRLYPDGSYDSLMVVYH